MKDVFEALNAGEDRAEAARRFNEHITESVRLLMARREGRVFLRWLGEGQSAQTILNLIMDYEEGNHAR